jgi:2-keto-3-deoxy-L-rhamnonate aldolase RhmA
MRFPPKGNRGYSSSARTFGYGLKASSDLQTIRQPLLFAQIEDFEGVNNAEAIAQIEGVDVLFVGPADLKLDLSTRPLGSSIPYSEALERVSFSAQRHGKQTGILVRDPTDLPALRQLGYSCLAINSGLAILRNGFRAILES